MVDRDGVINKDLPTSVRSISEFTLLPGVAEAISLLNQAGIPVAVVTNQAIVGRGHLPLEELERIHHTMGILLAEHHARVDEIFLCTDVAIEPHFRRKPAPGMLYEALEKFKARASYAPFIGDAVTDLQAAAQAGCPRILVRTGKGKETEAARPTWEKDLSPVHIFSNLLEAVQALLASRNEKPERPFYTLTQSCHREI